MNRLCGHFLLALAVALALTACSPAPHVNDAKPAAPSAGTAEVARRFVAAINSHDLDALVGLMSPQYVFVDSLGASSPFSAARQGWTQYFAMVPDYRIDLDEVVADGEGVLLIGRAGGTFVPTVPAGGAMEKSNHWETTAAWKAVVSEGRITRWQVFCDNEPIRQVMRASGSPKGLPDARVTGIGGIFFKAKDHKALTAWYAEQLGLPPSPFGVKFDWQEKEGGPGSTVWAVFPAKTKYFDPTVAPFMIDYRVKDLDGVLARLRKAGARVDDKIDSEENGRFGWAVDPEGNRFELWEPAAGH